jgi:hypothetical protein
MAETASDPFRSAACAEETNVSPLAAQREAAGRTQAAGAGPQRFRDTTVGRIFAGWCRAFASLQLAIGLLTLFALSLATGTLLESAYDAQVARFLVYRTWWFRLLLAALAVNVLGAALKKMDPHRLARWSWPWKKHQAGFLITHAGLLVLVLGGMLTAWGGTEGQMLLSDTDNREIQQWAGVSNHGSTILLNDRHQIEVYQVPRTVFQDDRLWNDFLRAIDGRGKVSADVAQLLKHHSWRFPFSPGPLAWHADETFRPELPGVVRVLHRLADPFPGWSRGLSDLATLRVDNFYPHTEYRPYSEAPDQAGSFPALKLRLTSPLTVRPMDRWVTGMPALERETSPVALEMLLLRELALVEEFLNPPSPDRLGPDGQLVLAVGQKRRLVRVAVDRKQIGKPIELPGTGLRLTLVQCGDLLTMAGHPDVSGAKGGSPKYHTVRFDLAGPAGKGEYLACARFPNLPPLQGGTAVGRIAVWYHHPDFRWGDDRLMGSVQFLHAPDGKVFYRVYGKDGLRQKGRPLDLTDLDQVHALPWRPMDMRFQVAAYLPHAVAQESFVPHELPPGAAAPASLQPGLRCSLTAGGATTEFRLRLSSPPRRVQVGDETFFVRYRLADEPVDFDLTLKHAQQVSDPGTDRAASFQSDVEVRDAGDSGAAAEHRIAMNQPLHRGRYRVFQASYRPLIDPETSRLVLDPEGNLVSLSGLAVSYDPGLYCKYAGSCLLVLGIATMFFMKAYFFKPRRRGPARQPGRA